MARNLDLTALRAFATVASSGGVTRAAGLLNLTQSAVSMQLRRLEEALGVRLLERTPRGVDLTPEGERALGLARRMLDLNDALLSEMLPDAAARMIRLGVPHDVVFGAIPEVLRALAAEHPGVRVELTSSTTRELRAAMARGECDLIVTTETAVGAGGRALARRPLTWVGAPEGTAWRRRPLPVAAERDCLFRGPMRAALDGAGIEWTTAVLSSSSRTVEATVGADLAIYAVLDGMAPPGTAPVVHGGALPDLPTFEIGLYLADPASEADPAIRDLTALLGQVYGRYGARSGQAEPVRASPRPFLSSVSSG
jgi:DNA-binding transcriptional LysR family regulator